MCGYSRAIFLHRLNLIDHSSAQRSRRGAAEGRPDGKYRPHRAPLRLLPAPRPVHIATPPIAAATAWLGAAMQSLPWREAYLSFRHSSCWGHGHFLIGLRVQPTANVTVATVRGRSAMVVFRPATLANFAPQPDHFVYEWPLCGPW